MASSIDGFIAGINEDVSGFIYDGQGVEKYLEDLKSYQTMIMGRSTYEFGYKFGAQAGQPSPAYPHMKHYIFSNRLHLQNQSQQVEVKKMDIEQIQLIKKESPTDIYLCGGGKFAGWLLENKQIDALKIKLNPIIMGNGIKLFENLTTKYQLQLTQCQTYENGLQIISYTIIYP